MRRVPHPVVVITSSLVPHTPVDSEDIRPPSDLESYFRGMTVSSFNTVSLQPQPLISFNVRLPSATYDALVRSQSFLAHILSSSPDGALIADTFAKGNNGTSQAFERLARNKSSGVKIFAGRQMQWAPLLSGNGVLRVLRCVALPGKEIVVGDHVVLVGEVVGIVEGQMARGASSSGAVDEDLGLIYVDQGYRSTGVTIVPKVEESMETARTETHEDDAADDIPFRRTLGMNVRRGDEFERS